MKGNISSLSFAMQSVGHSSDMKRERLGHDFEFDCCFDNLVMTLGSWKPTILSGGIQSQSLFD